MTVAALSDESVETFELIQAALDTGALALVSTALNGEPVAALSVIQFDGETYTVQPVAILVNDELFARLTPPDSGLHPDLPDDDEPDPDVAYDDRVLEDY